MRRIVVEITPHWQSVTSARMRGLSIGLLLLSCIGVRAQPVSTWQPATTSGGWLDATRWDGGVPNFAGAVARVPVTSSNLTIGLSEAATLGRLEIVGPGTASFTGTGSLNFDNPGLEPASIRLVPTTPGTAVTANLNYRGLSAVDDQLVIEVAPASTLNLGSIIGASVASLSKVGGGTLALGGASPNWGGAFSISDGRVTVNTASALGTTAGRTTVTGSGIVNLRAVVSEPFELASGGMIETSLTTANTYASPILLSSNGVVRHTPTTGGTTWSGVLSGPGGVTWQNVSTTTALVISGANTYAGPTYFSGTSYRVTNPTALGTTDEGTTIQSGTLNLEAPSDESFTVNSGGVLNLTASSASYGRTITLDGGRVNLPSQATTPTLPVVVGANGGTVQFPFGASWTGGSTGSGSLRLIGRGSVDAPLAQDGDLILEGMVLNVPNTYTGKTTIVGDYVLNRADVFGTATSPIEFSDGQITLHTLPNGNRGFILKRGTLDVRTPEPINAGITLGGTFEAGLRGIGTFNAPIDYATVAGGGNASISGGTFNAPIRGNTFLNLGAAEGVTLNADNDIRGLVHISTGVVTINHQDALNLPGTLVQGGLVEMKRVADGLPMLQRYPYGDQQTGTFRLHVDQDFAGLSYLGEGKLEANADVRFEKLLLRKTDLATTAAGSVTIDRELTVYDSGVVSGKLKGAGVLRILGGNLNASGDLSQFHGDMSVERGRLSLLGPTPLGGGEIRIGREGTLDFGTYFAPTRTVDNTIYLHNGEVTYQGNGHGILYNSYGSGPLTLAGRLDVGDQGADHSG